MPRRKRSKPTLATLIFPLALILFGLSMAVPGVAEKLFSLLVNTLIFIALVGAAWFLYRRTNSRPKKTAKAIRTQGSAKAWAAPGMNTEQRTKSQSDLSKESAGEAVVAQGCPTPSAPLWSLSLLQDLEWKRFEQLCEAYFKARQLDARMTGVGADGGVDIRLYKRNSDDLFALMQCKAWSGRVGVKPVRELYGVMASEGIERGIFLCSGDYTKEARAFCEGKRLRLMSGENLLNAVSKLDEVEQQGLLKIATEGDYRTPTCPNCDIKLTERKGAKGRFWGCHNFPRCRYTAQMKKQPKKVDYSYLSNA